MSQSTLSNPSWFNFVRLAATILVPILLILTSVRLLLVTAKTWTNIEYRMPGFPADPHGFDLEDRLYWSSLDIDYLHSDEGPDYFDDLILDDGSPMHNERELLHMEDVKRLVNVANSAWIGGIVLLTLLFALLWRFQGSAAVGLVLTASARSILILMGVLAVLLIFAFGFLFVGFHRVLFPPNTWTFLTSDTFIRLYPVRFWQDTFVLFGLITTLEAALLYVIGKWILPRFIVG